ncbi:MAG: GNAT family N-acetyltransferase [Microbacterium sp.]|uniref:GNAT family N-acetyltransferase n=1 Tax=Microbacterium sp. TaxID=51671 RepID=UPI0039E22EB1
MRILRDEDAARIGRVVTAPSARRGGIGARIMRQAIARCAQRWPRLPIALDAQAHLAHWYARFGFAVSGPGFVEDGIPHVPMCRDAGMPVPSVR